MKLKIMGKAENDDSEPKASTSSGECSTTKAKPRNQGKKRKREASDDNSDDESFPDNAVETSINVHASALKNNLDEAEVRRILKKVVTNDRVLALVKQKEEEEEESSTNKEVVPKLTRAKVKELKKVKTTKSSAWDLEKLKLTPIKHIPVKTRPEVKALIAQELPEDEDDDEYEPTHDEVLSDDDHVESCSDLDSQPRTPATPVNTPSPRVLRDGPFKVPQDISRARRKLDIEEEEATIALRTRSKLSLSATSIEHIESTFVPPDDIPMQDVDDLWNQFLNECLNPASVSRHDDDDEALDETDPEYNVAADPDAHDEDEESLSNSIIKISKKELNDLVTELFNIMPNTRDELPVPDTSQLIIPKWEGKQEPVSDDEIRENPSKKLRFEKELTPEMPENTNIVQITEKETVQSEKANVQDKVTIPTIVAEKRIENIVVDRQQIMISKPIEISIEGSNGPMQEVSAEVAPPSLRDRIKPTTQAVQIQIESNFTMYGEQLQIFQQQVRQHVQLAASNYMQTVVHPVNWKMAPKYKEYLESLVQLANKRQDSAVDVCNLRPAYELITIWEKSVTADTPENREMIEFLVKDVAKSRRRVLHNSLYTGEFHETLQKVIANSPVFLYPHLLPSMPYRADPPKKTYYLTSEERLIVLGLDQFWQYVENNPELYKLPPRRNGRRGYNVTVELVCKHMFPWIATNRMASHITSVRSFKDELNPLYRYFKYDEIPTIEHKILPYNPTLTLYELPEHEMPRIWAKYLAKSSQRFKKFIQRRSAASMGLRPDGTTIATPQDTTRKPLPIAFTKKLFNSRSTLSEEVPPPPERIDINVQPPGTNQSNVLVAQNFYRLVETSTGAYLQAIHIDVNGKSTDSVTGPPTGVSSIVANNLPETRPPAPIYSDHCECCILLRKICKKRQTHITEYFKTDIKDTKCYCNNVRYPRITNRLRLLINSSKKSAEVVFNDIEKILEKGNKDDDDVGDSKDMAHVLSYQVKVFTQASMCKRIKVKKRIHNLLSSFDLDQGNPVKLAMDLFKACDTELVDLYQDFMSFLNPEQAEQLAAFKDYFVRNCAKSLMEKIEELVEDKATRLAIIKVLKSTISRRLSPCVMCSTLLRVMEGYGKLAQYTFHLFPHTKENRPAIIAPVALLAPLTTSTAAPKQTVAVDVNDTEPEHLNTAAYEADDSSSTDDDAMSVDHNRPRQQGPETPHLNSAANSSNQNQQINQTQPLVRAKQLNQSKTLIKAQPLSQTKKLNQTKKLKQGVKLNKGKKIKEAQSLNQTKQFNQTQHINQPQPLIQTKTLRQTRKLSQDKKSEKGQTLIQTEQSNQTQQINQAQPLNQTEQLNQTQQINQAQPLIQTEQLNQTQQINQAQLLNQTEQLNQTQQINQAQPLIQTKQLNQTQQINQAQLLIQTEQLNQTQQINQAQSLNQTEQLNQTQQMNQAQPLIKTEQLNQVKPLNQTKPLRQTQILNKPRKVNQRKNNKKVQPLSPDQQMNQDKPLTQTQPLSQTQPLNQTQMMPTAPSNQDQHLLENQLLKQVQSVIETRPIVPNKPSSNIDRYEDSDSDHNLSIDENTNVRHEMEYTTDWTKYEDRAILKVLQEHVTKEERKDKTIVDLLGEKNVYGMLLQSLDRTTSQIKERVLYLLTMLVVSESDT